ncbi:MAG: 50S ribosomal protein L29 [Kofleriaceae bacterium]
MSKTATHLVNLRDQADDELLAALEQTRDELFRLRLGMHTNQVSSTASVGTKRKEIAQILTILRARNLGLEAQAQSTKDKK